MSFGDCATAVCRSRPLTQGLRELIQCASPLQGRIGTWPTRSMLNTTSTKTSKTLCEHLPCTCDVTYRIFTADKVLAPSAQVGMPTRKTRIAHKNCIAFCLHNPQKFCCWLTILRAFSRCSLVCMSRAFRPLPQSTCSYCEAEMRLVRLRKNM
jgi:hypothetical protein